MQKKHIIFIHGGTAFREYSAFLEHLRTVPIDDPFDREKEEVQKWKMTLRDELADHYDVLYPRMPNAQNAQYCEWKIWFERYLAFVSDGVVLIGHSQGGYFLAKYLSEESPPVTVRAVYLVAAPCYPDAFGGEDGGDFAPDVSRLQRLPEVAESVCIVHSTDDPIVPFAHAREYQKHVPAAELIQFSDRGHFLQPSFPELLTHIRALDA